MTGTVLLMSDTVTDDRGLQTAEFLTFMPCQKKKPAGTLNETPVPDGSDTAMEERVLKEPVASPKPATDTVPFPSATYSKL